MNVQELSTILTDVSEDVRAIFLIPTGCRQCPLLYDTFIFPKPLTRTGDVLRNHLLSPLNHRLKAAFQYLRLTSSTVPFAFPVTSEVLPLASPASSCALPFASYALPFASLATSLAVCSVLAAVLPTADLTASVADSDSRVSFNYLIKPWTCT